MSTNRRANTKSGRVMRWIQRQFPKQQSFNLHQNSTLPNVSHSVRAAPTAPVTTDTENQPRPRPYSQHVPSDMSTSFDVDDDDDDGVAAVRDMVGKPLVWTAGGVDGTEVDIDNDSQLEAELMRDAYPPDGIPPPQPNGEGSADRIETGPADRDDEELEAELMRDVYPTDGIPPPQVDNESNGGRRGTDPVESPQKQQQKQQQQGVVNEISSGMLDRIIAEGEVERRLKQQQVSSSDMLQSSDMGWMLHVDSECRGGRRGTDPVESPQEQQQKQQQQGVVNEISSGMLDRIIAEGEVEQRLKQQQVSSSDMLQSSDMGWIKKLGDDDDDEVAQAADILQQTVQARRL